MVHDKETQEILRILSYSISGLGLGYTRFFIFKSV